MPGRNIVHASKGSGSRSCASFAVNEEFKLVLVFEYGETTVPIGAFPLEVTVVQEDVVVDAEDVDFTCLEEL